MSLQHFLSSKQLTEGTLQEELLSLCAQMNKDYKAGNLEASLEGKVVACLFFEPSTRTRLSFETAALRLGAKVIDMQSPSSSSTTKGESLEDTIKIVNGYADAIVMRHPEEGAAERAAKVSEVPIINAGDGGNQHPSQTLLDLYTIKKELGRLSDLKVAFGLDPKHSRAIKSLALTLSKHKDNSFTFISPEILKLPADLVAELKNNGAEVKESEKIEDALGTDIFYINRLQEERFENKQDFEDNRKKLTLTKAMLEGKKTLVMDPLPRLDEMEKAVDDLPNAIYFKQAKNGLYARMALLHTILS